MGENRLDSLNLVIDIGSSGIRAVAFSLTGKMIAASREDYATYYPLPGWAEQNPDDWQRAALDALADLVGHLPKGVKINGLSFTGQCPSYLPVDSHIHPLGNVLTYQDNRSIEEAKTISALVGDDYVHDRSGHSVEPFFILPKLLWHKRHDPSLFSKIYKVLQPCDYLEYLFTGNLCTDPAYACGTLVYDRYIKNWNRNLLEKLDIPGDIFPENIIHSWDVTGIVREDVARLTGLPVGTKVIRGGPDSQCCALGVAAIETDVLSNMSGTSTCLNRTLLEPMTDLRVGHYAHVVPDRWSAEVGLNTTGVSLKKVAKMLFPDLDDRSMYRQVEACAARSPAGSHDLLFFPYLSNGERDNQSVKGGFYNLSMMTCPDDMIRAVLEGVAFAEKERADLLLPQGEKFSTMRISGGGASLDLWCQIKSNIMEIPVRALKDVDAAELGASMLVSIGTGLVSDYLEAIRICELQYVEFEPDSDAAAIYKERYHGFIAFEKAVSCAS